MKKKIWFDMDGTIADFYAVDGWVEYLANSDVFPYATAKPMHNFSVLARLLNELQRRGYFIGVISWASRTATPEYKKAIDLTKRDWLARHLKSVNFDKIEVVAYGTPKEVGRDGILFDDNEEIRKAWGEGAFEPKEIISVLKGLLKAEQPEGRKVMKKKCYYAPACANYDNQEQLDAMTERYLDDFLANLSCGSRIKPLFKEKEEAERYALIEGRKMYGKYNNAFYGVITFSIEHDKMLGEFVKVVSPSGNMKKIIQIPDFIQKYCEVFE